MSIRLIERRTIDRFGSAVALADRAGGVLTAYGECVTGWNGAQLLAPGRVMELSVGGADPGLFAAPYRWDSATGAWGAGGVHRVVPQGYDVAAATWDPAVCHLLVATAFRPTRGARPGAPPTVRSHVVIWDDDAGTSRTLAEDDDHMRGAVALAGDLAVAAGRGMVVWNTHTGEEVARLALDGHRAEAVAIHQDGRVVAAALADGTVRVWRVDGAPVLLAAVAAHEGAATGLAFRQDGTMVTCGDDGRLALHDATGRRLAEAQLPDPLGDLSLSPDGTRVAVIARPPASGAAEYTIVSE